MAIVSQGNSVVIDVDSTSAIWVKSTGNAEVTVNRGGTPEVSNVTTEVGRFGYYGEPVQVTIRSVTGQAEYQDQQFSIQPLTSTQMGGKADSSPTDVALAVNGLILAQPKVVNSQYFVKLLAGGYDAPSGFIKDESLAQSDAKLGANLSATDLNANVGYLTTKDPVTGQTDSGIRMPPLQYDYAGGESLVVFWKGVVTPEGTVQVFLGDTVANNVNGVAFRVDATGTCSFFLGSTDGGLFSGNSTKVVFDGSLHSFAFILDGRTRKVLWMVDGNDTVDPYLLSTGTIRNSISKNTFSIGSVAAGAGTAAGIATRTQALHVFKSYKEIDYAKLYQVLNQLHFNPSKSATEFFK